MATQPLASLNEHPEETQPSFLAVLPEAGLEGMDHDASMEAVLRSRRQSLGATGWTGRY